LTLHPEDERLIEAVAEANPRTVVAIMAGSAVITEAWRDKVAAIIMLSYPGQEGGHAFADVLLGRVNPSGKLPFVVPRGAGDLPFFDMDATSITYDLWHPHRKLERDGPTPEYPFGFGLGYTRPGPSASPCRPARSRTTRPAAGPSSRASTRSWWAGTRSTRRRWARAW
jgi:beta-glucosidase